MKTINKHDVIVPEGRQRQEFQTDSLMSLSQSMLRIGQLHAIVLENDGRTLRAGERRLRAARLMNDGAQVWHDGQLMPADHIAYTTLADLSEEQLYEIELEENIQRVDLTWQERAIAMDKLYALHQVRAGGELSFSQFTREVKGPDTPAGDYFPVKAAQAVSIAKHLDDPEVAGAKSQKEALNIVKRKQNSILQQELAKRIAELGMDAGPGHQLLLGSSFDLAAQIPSNSVDIILTDPPYGIDMDKMNTQSGSSSGLTHDYSDDEQFARSCVDLVAREGWRIARASAVCYMFCDMRFYYQWAAIFEQYGWYIWPNPIIWNKSPTGSLLGAANGPRHCYETVLMAIKGNKPVNSVGNDIISIPGPSKDKKHPAEKPVELYAHLLAWSVTPGDKIVDFFCGCGPIFPAASQFQCTAIGIERNEAHHATATLRMGEIL